MITLNKLSKALLASIGMIFTSQVMAADIAHSIRNNTESNASTENYFELGLYAYTGISPSITSTDDSYSGLGLLINGSYNFHGLFIEKYGASEDPLLLGYNAYSNDNWSFDLTLGPRFGGLPDDEERFDNLDERGSSTLLGGRLTGDFNGNTVQFSFAHDISGHSKGYRASALIGHNWQVRNWNFHTLAGINYVDAKMSDFYIGISKDEAARTDFEEYKSGGRFGARVEAGVTYPITQDWVFRATGSAFALSDELTDSPLFLNKRSNGLALVTSLSYVF